jgi:hypothetical protein
MAAKKGEAPKMELMKLFSATTSTNSVTNRELLNVHDRDEQVFRDME